MGQETVFGWIFSGRSEAVNPMNRTYGHQPIQTFHTCINIDSRLQTLGHMALSEPNSSTMRYYIPHHVMLSKKVVRRPRFVSSLMHHGNLTMVFH